MTLKSKLVTGGIAIAIAGLLVSTQVVSQEKETPQKGAAAGMQEMMAKWAAVNAKGPEHEAFRDMVGKWDTITQMWMAPGVPPTEAPGQAEFRLILDGRFVEQVYKCEAMAFEGLAITGYDRFKKKYVSIWLDSMSNAMCTTLGTADASGKVFTYYGTVDDPMTGEQDILTKMVLRELSTDKVIAEMYEKRAGTDERKTMEIVYARAK